MDPYKPRRSDRTPVAGRTQLRSQSRCSLEIRIRDVSASGFMAECSAPVRIGSYVSLDLPGIGPVNAQVRWQLGDRMGGQFIDPVSLHRCGWTAAAAEAPLETA